MAGKSERAKVEIKESSTLDVRTFNITLTAPASDFQLTDLLRQRGVIDALDAELKQAVKGATERYLNIAENLIAGLAAESTPAQKTRTNARRHGKPGKDERARTMSQSEQPRDLSSDPMQAR